MTISHAVPRPPDVPLERANRARTEAFEARAEAKISIYQGILTPTDIILEAATEDGHALMNIRLVNFSSQPGWGMKPLKQFSGFVRFSKSLFKNQLP
jgi:hypothetical protein